ncbi:unnamed protein product [Spirodela intermedia]|uniref:Uncharacterized protein n=1 Tax=Spirodela intermedia TaxID=51605 RepID=A0A7I8INK5_SPIIN|nr:unnamed protein product [Spirodela intermedia]CAA6658718.1 unnamed protein product [Spirodela intermedia]
MASVKFFAVVAAALLLSSSLLVSAQLPDEDCVFAGPCRTRLDCARPCKALGHSPTAVLCEPYIGGLTCCCLL